MRDITVQRYAPGRGGGPIALAWAILAVVDLGGPNEP
jgi:hypothetical protein